MKTPNIADLDKKVVRPDSAFEKTITAEKEKASAIERKTYSLEARHTKFINEEAARLSQERGKPVGASEALRAIIERAAQ